MGDELEITIPISPGKLSIAMVAWCSLCHAKEQFNMQNEYPSLDRFEEWFQSSAFGWVCPKCKPRVVEIMKKAHERATS
jgi:hypothetical protein